jgi:cobalamin biosynthetic protein CobC
MDSLLARAGAQIVGGTSLFRLVAVPDAQAMQERLARDLIWTRTFPYSQNWIRFGLPASDDEWTRLATALETAR